MTEEEALGLLLKTSETSVGQPVGGVRAQMI